MKHFLSILSILGYIGLGLCLAASILGLGTYPASAPRVSIDLVPLQTYIPMITVSAYVVLAQSIALFAFCKQRYTASYWVFITNAFLLILCLVCFHHVMIDLRAFQKTVYPTYYLWGEKAWSVFQEVYHCCSFSGNDAAFSQSAVCFEGAQVPGCQSQIILQHTIIASLMGTGIGLSGIPSLYFAWLSAYRADF